MVVNIAGMSLKKQASRGGQHHRNRWSRWIRIGGQDGSEYTIEGTDIAFAKLFRYSESQDAGDYLNLIYKFPDYFPNTIMNSLVSEI